MWPRSTGHDEEVAVSDNNVTIVGNVTRDPEMRYTSGGRAVATIGVAVNRRWKNQQSNDWQEETSYFDVICWGDLGENVVNSITKGARVMVSGRLEQRSWETETGDKRSKVEIIADEVGPSLRWATAEVRRTPREGGNGNGNGAPQRQQAAAPAPAQAPSGGGYDPYDEPF